MNRLDKPNVEHVYQRMEQNRRVNAYLNGQLIENQHENQRLFDTLSRKLVGYAYYVFQQKGWKAKLTFDDALMANVDSIKAYVVSHTTRGREYFVTFSVNLPPVSRRAHTFETISYKKLPETVDFGKLFMEQFLQALEPLNELDSNKLEKKVNELNSKTIRKLILEVLPQPTQ